MEKKSKKSKKTTSKKEIKAEIKEDNYDVSIHNLVPKHKVLSEENAKKVMEEYGITIQQFPKILKTDAAIQELDAQVGDVIEITRKSSIVGSTKYYRGVVSD